MTKNRICEFFAGAKHCCWAQHVLGEPQPKAVGRPLGLMGTLNWGRMAYGIFLLCLTTAIASRAQTFTTLHNFDGTDGGHSYLGMVQATNGKLYGTTSGGEVKGNYGTVFKMTPSGKLKTLYTFCSQNNCTDGYHPTSELVQATNGNLYGTTAPRIVHVGGTVFKITPSGKLKTLYTFCSQDKCTDGVTPYAGLVQATDGNLYGTTYEGGTNNLGTVFQITPSGTWTKLHDFAGTDGARPVERLVQATNGNLYGTTGEGGTSNVGTVFKITLSGTLTKLHDFAGTDGRTPYAGLIQARNGNLYGATEYGGAQNFGTVFKITPSGTLTKLHDFGAGTDGRIPYPWLVQATDGNLYGTTENGGTNNFGTVFKMTPSGTLTTLHDFAGTDGTYPHADLIQDTNGSLYGMTHDGGANGDYGTVFRLSVGLGPFVETQPTSGKVGAAVRILGTKLTGATSVTFNGTAAKFTVVSKSEIKTTVPVGATTGKVKVTTPSATLSSNVRFRVTK